MSGEARASAGDRSPAFQFYPRDFLADENVRRMSHAEVGIYVQLLAFCWIEGSIPADLGDLAMMLGRTPRREIERAWRVVGRCFEPHPSEPDRLVNPRLDRERQKQTEYRDRQSEAGRRGAAGRWGKSPRQPDRVGMAVTSGRDGDPNATAMRFDGSSSASASSAAAHASRVCAASDEPTSPLEFGVWFVSTGAAEGAIPGHLALDSTRYALRDLESAEALVGAYGIAEAMARARRLFARKVADGPAALRAAATIGFLARNWEWFAEDAAAPTGAAGGADLEHGWLNGEPHAKRRGTYVAGFSTIPPDGAA